MNTNWNNYYIDNDYVDNKYKIIESKRNKTLSNNSGSYRLTADSYKGGFDYIDSDYLYRYHRENTNQYKGRKERASYINHVQPLADMLTSYIFESKPQRETPEQLSYILNNASNQMNFDKFMETLSLHTMLYPVLILVDAPKTDGEQLTIAQRKQEGINPFLKIYKYNEILDFCFSDDGVLEWVLLDDSYVKQNIFEPDEKIKRYTLWTKDFYQSFIFHKNRHGKTESVEDSGEIEHDLGVVPAVFSGWGNLQNSDDLQISPFQNISLMSRSVFNLMSVMDEALYSGSFKTMVYPIMNDNDMPDKLMTGGLGDIAVLPYNGNVSGQPQFISAETEDLSNHREQIKILTKEIFRQVGLKDPESDSKYYDSGIAKSIQFRNTSAVLTSYASELENTEQMIFKFLCAYEGINPNEIKINYNKDYNVDDIDNDLNRLYQALDISADYEAINKHIKKEIIKKLLTDTTEAEDMKELLQEIEETKEELNPAIESVAVK